MLYLFRRGLSARHQFRDRDGLAVRDLDRGRQSRLAWFRTAGALLGEFRCRRILLRWSCYRAENQKESEGERTQDWDELAASKSTCIGAVPFAYHDEILC